MGIYIQSLDFCKDQFLNLNKSWYTDQPKLTRCLSQIGFSVLPFLLIFFLILFELISLIRKNKNEIPLNKNNFFRYFLSILLLISNIYLLINYITLVNENDFLKLSDYLSAFCKLLTPIFILLLFHFHRLKSIKTSGVVWVILLVQVFCSTVLFLDVMLYNSQMYLYSELINTKMNFFSYLFLFLGFTIYSDSVGNEKKNLNIDDSNIETKNILRSNCSFFYRITYIYLNKFIALSRNITVDIDKVLHLDKYMKVKHVANNFEKEYFKEKGKVEKYNRKSAKAKKMNSWNLIKIGFKLYGKVFCFANLIIFFNDLLSFVKPLLLKYIIDFVSDETIPKFHGLLIALGFLFLDFLGTILNNYHDEVTYSIGLNLQTGLKSLIYSKSLIINSEAKNRCSTGEIMNLLSIDVSRIDEIISLIGYIWSSPFQIILAVYMVYNELGVSVFAGISLLILTLILNSLIINYFNRFYLEEMSYKDNRIKIINEFLSGIRVIKLYCWETAFQKKIFSLRKKEVKQMRNFYLLEVFDYFFMEILPTLVLIITLSVFTYLNNIVLTPQKIFVSIALFNLLQSPIDSLPGIISFAISCKGSLARINSFLNEDELNDYVKHEYDSDAAISIKNDACFTWKKKPVDQLEETSEINNLINQKNDKNHFELKNINLDIKKGSLVGIIGKVGSSGKSSLLNAILGEMILVENSNGIKGTVNVSNDQKIFYVPQQAWIQNCTLKDNVLFGKEYCEVKYLEILKACALVEDLKSLPNGDETKIGDKGINLSGGQKQRVSLARAAYSDSNLIILDDSLSAVDVHVSKHLVKNLLNSETGVLKNSTRVLVTNQINLLDYVDQVIVLENGSIALNCSVDEFKKLKEKGELNKFDLKFEKNQKLKEEVEKLENSLFEELQDEIEEEEEEKIKTGRVSFKNYLIYFKNVGYISCFLVFMAFLAENTFALFAEVVLSIWANVVSQPLDKIKIQEANKHYLMNYIEISVLQCVFQLIGGLIFVYGVVKSLKLFHLQLLSKIIRSKMKFFDITPIGRIINRFSSDIESIDRTIPADIRDLLPLVFKILISFSLLIYNIPIAFVFLIILIVVYYRIQVFYVGSSRQIRRLKSKSKSPILSHFGETLDGRSIIRANNATEIFKNNFTNKMEIYNRCYYSNLLTNRWLNVRLDCLGIIIVFVTTIYIVFYRIQFNGGQIGLLMSYCICVTDYFNSIVKKLCSIETDAVSIERVSEYLNNEQEDKLVKDFEPNSNWPEGTIEFVNYSTSYGDNLVLKNLNFKIENQDKVGVVGRTGAGKTSLTSALFRLIEPTNGKILIDNIDISEIGLNMRSKLSIIPQDPVIFSGSIRYNLDPFNNYTDDQIWSSIELVNLKQFVNSLDKGIYYEISEGGSNLSVGQKQLLCLARALLKKSKILILDEATASIDFNTDEIIQKTIKKEFKDSTILTIAHRINTILDYDKVIVLDKGEVIEYDRIEVLLKNPESSFYKMVKEANIL